MENTGKIYMIGIGGIGMSALAIFFLKSGARVSGYDRSRNEISRKLEKMGIPIHYEEDLSAIPKDVEMVIYTPAIPRDHAELKWYQENGYEVKKRSQVLLEITRRALTIAVAGTHGKTTVSAMIAHLLKVSGFDCTAFLGGIAKNYDSNYIDGRQDVMVVEADEFDRSFLNLIPKIAIITSIDEDHLDIYENYEDLESTFLQFTKQIKEGGELIIKAGLPLVDKIDHVHYSTYALEDGKAIAEAKNIRIEDGKFHFDYYSPKAVIKNISLLYPGIHNVENCIAAITTAKYLKIDDNSIKKGIESFTGIKRRFDYIIRQNNLIFIDDYAHHPKEIKMFLKSVNMLYPGKKVTAVFQPHLYSRTRDFAEQFAENLQIADEIILLDIYPAREQPIEGVTSKLIYDRIHNRDRLLATKENLVSVLKERHLEVLVTLGAGDIDELIVPIKKSLTGEYHES